MSPIDGEAAPLDPTIHRSLAEARRNEGDELGALAHLIAADTLERYAAGSADASARGICDVATGYFMKHEHDGAAYWYRLALTLDAQLAVAHQNLAAIHEHAERPAEAEACRQAAYRIQRVFVESDGAVRRRVLILCAGRSSANVPFEALLPLTSCCRIKYAIDYASVDEDERLPPYDLVFNAVGESEIAATALARLDRFAERCRRPLLNVPRQVARTQRHLLADLLAGLPDLLVPPCIRCEAPASRELMTERLTAADIDFPLLLRPAVSHGGQGLVRCESLDALLDAAPTDAFHLTAFVDSRSADGYYRKYRMIFVDRRPYPYHLAISPHWLVHYASSGTADDPARRAEEARFLEHPDGALGPRAMVAITMIGRRLDLDYAGIDFTLLPDGRVLVFEANATMLVHRNSAVGALAHKNLYVERIVDAFEAMLARTAND